MPSQRDVVPDESDAAVAPIDLADATGWTAARRFPIVGIGASAGGLDAFKALLAATPPDTGMAFVLIQHLDPLHASLMAELLSSRTTMPVAPAAKGARIEPNHVYLIPPGVSLSVARGKLHLSEPAERHGARLAFDFFLRSLAEDCGERAICVVLSGTGTDGSEGLKAVKKRGGFVIVQDPSEAAFDGMPKSAIKTGQADRTLPVARIPARSSIAPASFAFSPPPRNRMPMAKSKTVFWRFSILSGRRPIRISLSTRRAHWSAGSSGAWRWRASRACPLR